MDEQGNDDYFVTGWLDNIVGLVRNRRACATPILDTVAELEKIIRLSRPMEPICLTHYGDELRALPPRTGCLVGAPYLQPSVQDSDRLPNDSIGAHHVCGGFIDLLRTSR